MTTFLDTEKEAKAFARIIIKGVNDETFKQEAHETAVNQFGEETKGKGYHFIHEENDLEVIITETGRGWNVWIKTPVGICHRL